MTQTNTRFFGLDLLRASAILLVIISHANHLLAPIIYMPNMAGNIIGKIAALTDSFGLMGVELFFVLSGFLIGGILIRTIMNQDSFGFSSLKTFWMKRWLRTLPLYYLMLAIVAILNYYDNLHFDWRYIFFLQNFSIPHPGFFAETWSLAIEEWFYLSFPIVLMVFLYVFKSQPKKNTILHAILFYIIFFQLVRFANAFNPLYTYPDSGLRKLVCFRLDALMYGVLIAYFMQFKKDFLIQKKNIFLKIAGLGILVIMTLSLVIMHPKIDWFNKSITVRFLYNAFMFTLVPLFFSLTLPFFYFMKSPSNNLMKRFITRISRISYAMYLVHYSLIYLLIFTRIPLGSPAFSLFIFFSYWLVVVIISNFLYVTFEVPLLKWRDRISV